jgi:hypothetical protein
MMKAERQTTGRKCVTKIAVNGKVPIAHHLLLHESEVMTLRLKTVDIILSNAPETLHGSFKQPRLVCASIEARSAPYPGIQVPGVSSGKNRLCLMQHRLARLTSPNQYFSLSRNHA